MKYYVYKFVNEENEVIYIGRTNDLKRRMTTHHHLEVDCYYETYKKFYAELNSYADMVIYELYYINKLNPKYNSAQKKSENMDICLPELKFNEYDGKLNNRKYKNNNELLITVMMYRKKELLVKRTVEISKAINMFNLIFHTYEELEELAKSDEIIKIKVG